MNKRRLLKMADFVETIPRKHFDMREVYVEAPCGTVGCAMGWAAHKRLFRGLRYDHATSYVVYNDVAGMFDAANEIFGITDEVSDALFTRHDNHRTPKQVAKNLRRYVETGELP